jgi:Bacterial Ig-like domain (group 2)
MSHEDPELHKLYRELQDLVREVRCILRRQFQLLNDSGALKIPNQQGELTMGAPASLVMGGGSVNALWVESLNGVQQGSFQNGVTTGVLNGPPAFASSNPAVATVDPVLGTVTPVAPGNTVITATDAVGNLTDTVAATVTPAASTPNNTGALSIPAQGAAPAGVASAVKKL